MNALLNQTSATFGPALLLLFDGYLVVTGQTTARSAVCVVTTLAAHGWVDLPAWQSAGGWFFAFNKR